MIYDLSVSRVPAEIGGIGSTMQKLRVSPDFDPLKAQIGPDEFFVLSRIDGQQSLRDVLLATGLPIERGLAIVTRLRSVGALLLPGEKSSARSPSAAPDRPTPPRPPPPPAPPQPAPAPPTIRPAADAVSSPPSSADAPQPQGPNLALTDPTTEELACLAEPCDLPQSDRRKILAMTRLVDAGDPWNMLGVVHGADSRAVKRAYFKLSKDIHPDRYYGRQLGSFAQRLSHVFEGVSRAYERLTNPEKSAAQNAQAVVQQSQTPQEYAAELFSRAIALEVGGDPLNAMKLFSAAVRLDPQTKYLRRSASCALAAAQPHTALEYAKKAHSGSPADPSLARLLAAAFKACGKLPDAEDVLVMAMALKSDNDVLMAELRNDLAEVRRLLNS